LTISIINLADCEMQSVICFLNAQKFRSAEIRRQLVEMYEKDVT